MDTNTTPGNETLLFLTDEQLRKGIEAMFFAYRGFTADPDVFDIDRNPHHVGFGLGSHFCMGANLARMEMRVAFEEVLRRLPDMEYAGDGPVMAPSALVRTCAEMKVRFTPEA